MASANYYEWHKQERGKVHDLVFPYVRTIEQTQGDIYDRHVKLEALYDPFSPAGDDDGNAHAKIANVTENVVAGNVDTVAAAVVPNEVRARFMTDGADWSTQRRAKALEFYSEGLGKRLKRKRKCDAAFKSGAKKGNGFVKVTGDRWGQICEEHVPVQDVIVPDDCLRGGYPTQMHHVQRMVDKEELAAEYPQHADAIAAAHGRRSVRGGGPGRDGKLTVIESWRLPIGKRPANEDKPTRKRSKLKAQVRAARNAPKYVPGRHTITIENEDLLDEQYHKQHFPIAGTVWLEREGSFYGISLSERIAGQQRAINKRNWQIDKTLDQNANLTTFVRPADGNLSVKTTKIGDVAVVKGEWPNRPAPPALHPEVYADRERRIDGAYNESGVSRMAAQSRKPAGLDSGRALREYRDQTTQRFAPQEEAYEQLVLEVAFLELDVCKDLGEDAPVIMRQSRWKPMITWSEVDMGEVEVQIVAASTLNRTPAGREQTLIEWAQAGVISTDEFRRLIGHPDLERQMSLYTAAIESCEEQLEAILDGHEGIVPEPFDNLKVITWRGTAEYHNVRTAGAPEEILEALRTYIVQAAYVDAQKSTQNTNMPPGAAAGPAGVPGEIAPGGPQPSAAFATQAMDLMAG